MAEMAIAYHKNWLSEIEPGRPFRMRKGANVKDQLSRPRLREEGTLHTPEEIALRFKVKTETVWEWIRTKKLKAHRVGRQYRVSDAQVDEFIGAQK